jgi:3-deoxy-7-phosphoheptulonate synthase
MREQLMIDVSHGNSEKQYRRQIEICADIASRIAAGERSISGVMIESHLHEGRQDLQPGKQLREGVSITDACIGWDDTDRVLQMLAKAVRTGRQQL